tara:strand:- start:358 stop:657 length:300 start_codon:yes stop_codon:yes gene_type:complete
MNYNSFNTQWYTLEEKDVCEININSGSVTFKDNSSNTKGLKMDKETLIASIYEALANLVVTKDYSTYEEENNFEILKGFESTISNFIKTSEENKKKWEK